MDGTGFIYNKSSEILSLSYAQKISTGTKVMLEDNANAVIVTEDGTKYFLTSGSVVSFYEDGIEIKNGKVWIKSTENSSHTVVHTPNLKSVHKNGEYVYSFNSQNGKSEVLNIMGQCNISSALDENKKIKILAGQFSYILNGKNDGYPREATRVGLTSYEAIKLSFSNFKEIQSLKLNNLLFEKKQRSIASVSNTKKKGAITFVKYNYKKADRKIASVITKNKVSPKAIKTASVRIFGSIKNKLVTRKTNVSKKVESISQRLPASIVEEKKENYNTVSIFEKSLRRNIKAEPKHSSEVNQLIDELKSFKDDFAKEY
jgi:hypothetical protein